MEKLVSPGADCRSLPESYVLPPELQPEPLSNCTCKTLPIVDLGGVDGSERQRSEIINEISNACQEYGFFQVINHGVPEKVMDGMIGVAREFFKMRVEEGPKQSVNLSIGKVQIRRENLRHLCYPVEDYIHLWPEKPTTFREAVGTYSLEARGLAFRLLELIGEGLGLEVSYFTDQLTKDQIMSINHYPPCSDSDLTLGLPKHCDPSIITLLIQQEEVSGLQIIKDGEWMTVKPIPNAFVVNIGSQLQIISNGTFRSVEHRVVIDSSAARTSIVIFLYPAQDCIIEPAPPLINEHNPPLSRPFQYQDYYTNFVASRADPLRALEPFKVQL